MKTLFVVVVVFAFASFAAVATVLAAPWTWADSIDLAPVAGVHDYWMNQTVGAAFAAAVAAVVCHEMTKNGTEDRSWLLDGGAGDSWKLWV